MARKNRAEVEGGLYHVLARGNNRRSIFDSPADYRKFLALLVRQKARLPFFLYAYCLMTNHLHLLIERQAHAVGRIMHRLLTGYSQYYNRRYHRVGHLFQARHKAILCQSDRYLSELVRYIHLNPVRAGMVQTPEEYQYSSHRAYLGLVPTGIVDVDPVLRHFGAQKKLAREAFHQFVAAGVKDGHREELYAVADGRILGSEEFADATIHRIGEAKRVTADLDLKNGSDFQADRLVEAVEKLCRVSRHELCSRSKSAVAVRAKEMLVLTGLQLGATRSTLAAIIGISSPTLSRRADAARLKMEVDLEIQALAMNIIKRYRNESE